VVLALVVLGRAMFVDELGTADRLLSIAGGVLLLFLGVAMLSSHVVRPLAVVSSPIGRWAAFAFTVIAWPLFLLPYWLQRYGAFGPGSMAGRLGAFVGGAVLNPFLLPIVLVMWLRRTVTSWEPEWPAEFPGVVPDRVATSTGGENARRNPGRTAATAAALMIGIALVAFIATLTNGMKASNREAIEEQIAADYVVTSLDGYTPFVAAAGDALAASPVPEVVTSVRSDAGLVNDVTTEVGGIEPDTIADAYVFDWREGDDSVLATMDETKAVVSSNYAEDHDISVGDVLTVRSTADRSADVTVVGNFEPPPFYPLIESVNVSTELFDELYDRPRNRWTWANVPGDPSEENRTEMEAAIAGFPDTQLETREEWIEREDSDFNDFISFLYVMLTLAVFVSIFGMINTLVLSVYERTREIGMLRAVGMTRRQVRRMIRQESIITALIGAAIGLPLGIFLAALVNRALSEYDVRFAIPWGQLFVLTIVAIVIGILAAIMPARRAAKLNPLEAIAYE
ncbi:MAG TPA: FtsX-like permease family protein, partial [Gaiellaceae bacterium]|nr:FtsX-like permease family protein [Gaiellaceae bacterium]